jgi:tripeptidyl-peptidase-1
MIRYILALAFAGLAFGLQKYPLSAIPPFWKLDSRPVDPAQRVNFKIALKPQNADVLQKMLMERSTPGSPLFRQWLSNDEVTQLVAPAQRDVDRVIQWLNANGIMHIDIAGNRDWIIAQTAVANIEKLLKCTIVRHRNIRSGATSLNAISTYTIPDELADIVDFVPGLHDFPFGRWTATQTGNVGATQQITPSVIYSKYGTPTSGYHGSKKGSNAVVEFGNIANFSPEDLQQFFTEYAPALVGEVSTVVYGTNNPNGPISVEANLDVQYIMAVGVFVNSTDYKITGNENIEDLMLDYAVIVNSQTSPPLVHSISYGEYGGQYNNDTEQKLDFELQKMGVKGISVLLASGDNGVGCGERCTSQEFDFPSCPHITMVGATYIDTKDGKEKGATLSSGGFSKNFYRPSWQASQVDAYLNSGVALPTHTYYYVDGRAYPDVAAYGQNVAIVARGSNEAVSGTSCSAPIFAGVISLLNHELMSSGKSTLGFLNPWLYANPQMFTDITDGSNPYECCEGFNAYSGWDPVTGMGTPIYSKMRTAAFN